MALESSQSNHIEQETWYSKLLTLVSELLFYESNITYKFMLVIEIYTCRSSSTQVNLLDPRLLTEESTSYTIH